MFGGHDDNAQAAQPTTAAAAVTVPDGTLPAPAEPAVAAVPTPPAGAPPLSGYDPEGLGSAEGAAAAPAVSSPAATVVTPTTNTTTSTNADDLLGIKQRALQQLAPLVGHLDQTPEEKFRTTMMMIQAADNQALIKEAYEAAEAITDEKVRAQALLDIVNEINYFTQQQEPQQ